MKKIVNLILVIALCLAPMNVFAANVNGVNTQSTEASGKLIKLQNEYTGQDEWFIDDNEGIQHKILGYLPGVTKAFDSYLGLNIIVSGTSLKDESSSILVEQIDYTRYIGTAERAIVGKLVYKYDPKANSFNYSLTSIYDNSKYELRDVNNVLDPSLAGKTVVISGSIYPCTYFNVDKIYR